MQRKPLKSFLVASSRHISSSQTTRVEWSCPLTIQRKIELGQHTHTLIQTVQYFLLEDQTRKERDHPKDHKSENENHRVVPYPSYGFSVNVRHQKRHPRTRGWCDLMRCKSRRLEHIGRSGARLQADLLHWTPSAVTSHIYTVHIGDTVLYIRISREVGSDESSELVSFY